MVIELKELMEHKRLRELLPDFLREYREYRAVTDAEQIELDSIMLRIDNLLRDSFTATATEEGIRRREQMYGIVPPPDASLEERRIAVIAKEAGDVPYTIREYRNMLRAVCGEGNYTAAVDCGKYRLDVSIRAVERDEQSALSLQRSIDDMTLDIIPANIVYNSILFDNHTGTHKTFSGIACSTRRYYSMEVVD